MKNELSWDPQYNRKDLVGLNKSPLLCKNSIFFIIIMNFVTFLLRGLIWIYPGFANWYAMNVYPLLVTSVSRLNSLFPFSVGEFLLFLLFFFFITKFILSPTLKMVIYPIFKIHAKKKKQTHSFMTTILHIGVFLTSLLFVFNLTCGINYQRYTFASYTNLVVEESPIKDLTDLTRTLIRTSNHLSSQVPVDDTGSFFIKGDIKTDVVLAMQKLGQTYPVLSGYYPKPKPVFSSVLLSYQGITGIYSPFTIEANYNKDIPDYNIPEVMCHELAHLKGFMREDEAEFIAVLASRGSDNLYLQYSGNLVALNYCLNAIYASGNKVLYASLYDELSEQIKTEFMNAHIYWSEYEGIISDISEKANDAYLRINDQSDGVRSYGRMVDLLLADHKKLME